MTFNVVILRILKFSASWWFAYRAELRGRSKELRRPGGREAIHRAPFARPGRGRPAPARWAVAPILPCSHRSILARPAPIPAADPPLRSTTATFPSPLDSNPAFDPPL